MPLKCLPDSSSIGRRFCVMKISRLFVLTYIHHVRQFSGGSVCVVHVHSTTNCRWLHWEKFEECVFQPCLRMAPSLEQERTLVLERSLKIRLKLLVLLDSRNPLSNWLSVIQKTSMMLKGLPHSHPIFHPVSQVDHCYAYIAMHTCRSCRSLVSESKWHYLCLWLELWYFVKDRLTRSQELTDKNWRVKVFRKDQMKQRYLVYTLNLHSCTLYPKKTSVENARTFSLKNDVKIVFLTVSLRVQSPSRVCLSTLGRKKYFNSTSNL